MKRQLLISASVAIFAASSSAQTTTYGPLGLRMPASARALAMGDIAIAGRDDDVIFYNPAQLVVARGTSMSFTRLAPSLYGGTMSTVLRIGSGGLGVGVNYLEYHVNTGIYPISRDDILEPAAGNVSGTSTLATLGFAQVLRGVRFGASANYAVDEIGVDRFRSVVGDVGVARDFSRFTTALALQHLGTGMDVNPASGFRPSTNPALAGGSIKPPMKATLGVGWAAPAGPLDLTATAAVSAMREGHLSPGIGGEASWSWLSGYAISARGGVRYPHEIGNPTLTGGLGFVADRVAIDAGVEFLKGSRAGYRAGFRIR